MRPADVGADAGREAGTDPATGREAGADPGAGRGASPQAVAPGGGGVGPTALAPGSRLPRRAPGRWAAPALVAILAVVLLAWALSPPRWPAGVRVATSALFVKTDEPAPPAAADPRWTRRALPDDWQRTTPGGDGYGWYRGSFVLSAVPDEPWGVYLDRVSTTYRLFVNGVEVGDGGGMTGEIRRAVGRPQFDTVAAHLLRAGVNTWSLQLRVATNRRGGLGAVVIGPRDATRAIHDDATSARVTLPRAANLALLFAGLLVGVMWLRRPGDSLHGHFAALAVLWSVRNFHYTASPPGIPSLLWEAFVLASLGGVTVLMWRFMQRYTGGSAPRTERLLTTVAIAAPLVFVAIGEAAMSQLRLPWYLGCAAVGVLAIGTLVRHLATPAGRARTGGWTMLGAMVVTLLLGLADLAVTAGVLPFGPAARMAYGAPLLLTALVVAIAENYFAAFEQARLLNATLEQRVAERSDALEAAHARMAALERDRAIADERERLMRDMHDGVGSQLMTTLHAVERGGALDAAGVARLLREGIADLRLVIDSLDADERSLPLALANLRWRMEPQLRGAGVEMEWAVDDVRPPLPPGTVLQLLRIVREAIANAVRHAGARTLRVSLAVPDGVLLLEVADDGRGLPAAPDVDAAPTHDHRGLANMRQRARQVGATIAWQPRPGGGTRVALRLPLAAHAGGGSDGDGEDTAAAPADRRPAR